MNETEMQAIVQSLAQNQAAISHLLKAQGDPTKAAGSVQSATWLHGSLGIFASPGLEREIFSTHVHPYGIASILPKIPTVFEEPRFGTLTGFADDIGNEPSDPCDDSPTGYLKSCMLTAQFGRVARSTETIEMDKVMLKLHRGDFTDLIMVADLFGNSGFDISGLNQQQMLNVVTMSQMIDAAVRLERKLCEHVWTGSPANNNLGGGYKEFPGLDNQIATGQVDADTNTACPSLDSDVKDFDYNDVCGTTRDIVEYMSMLEYFIYSLAQDTGMLPVEWVWVMRPQLWQELTACWPCKYNTNRCTSIGGDHQVITDGRENITDRDRMRESMTIDVNGRNYRVITDNCISEATNITDGNLLAGQYASSIYFVPLRVRGRGVTYMEHLDYRKAESDIALLRGREDFWTDRGVYSWAYDGNYWCYKLQIKTEQRIILKTPQLAGRIDNVRYSPLQHLRDPLPDSAYWVDGGVSLRPSSTTYAVWK